jgi:hypothetical protein
MSWRDFEREVAGFFQARGYDIKYHVESLGKSGVIHEIDVLAVSEKESIACECKSGNQKPTKHLVAEWESTCRDLPFRAKPAIASESGFTYMGLLYAKAYDVMLITKYQHYPYRPLSQLELVDLSEIKLPHEI